MVVKVEGLQKADQDPAFEAELDMVTAVVARGRTLVINKRRHGPGALVELPQDEVIRLRRLGFLHNPNVPELTPTSGPQFQGTVGGVVRPI